MPSPLPFPCRAALLSAMLVIAPAIAAKERPPTVSILQPGGYETSDLDISALPHDGWLALVKHGDHWELVRTKVDLDPEIHSSSQPKALVFLHARRLSVGKVRTLEMQLPDGVDAAETAADGKRKNQLEMRFDAQRYRLILSAQGSDAGSNLVLDDGHTHTLLDTDTDSAQLMWAGDLDHDGRLDLIISTDHEDGRSADTCLYLSSAAGKHQIVKKVACQGFSG